MSRGGVLVLRTRWVYDWVMPEAETRKHSAQLHIRLTPEHDDLIRRAADHAGQTLTNWIRGVLVKAARQELGR